MKTKTPHFQNHKKAHFAVQNNEHWFSDNPPDFGKAFARKKANKRHKIVVKIVERAGKRAAKNGQQALAEALERLQEKLKTCRPGDRCGSLACPRCARAFQKAKVAAQETLITSLGKTTQAAGTSPSFQRHPSVLFSASWGSWSTSQGASEAAGIVVPAAPPTRGQRCYR
jgi:hypothetical protein